MCSASDRQGSNFESCVWRAVSSHSFHHPREVLQVQFSLCVHKCSLSPHSFLFIGFEIYHYQIRLYVVNHMLAQITSIGKCSNLCEIRVCNYILFLRRRKKYLHPFDSPPTAETFQNLLPTENHCLIQGVVFTYVTHSRGENIVYSTIISHMFNTAILWE